MVGGVAADFCHRVQLSLCWICRGETQGKGAEEEREVGILLPLCKEERPEKLRVLEWFLGAGVGGSGAIRRQIARTCDGGNLATAHVRGKQDHATGRNSLKHVATMAGGRGKTGCGGRKGKAKVERR